MFAFILGILKENLLNQKRNLNYICIMKTCNTCNETKEISCFRNRNQCKSCENKIRYQRKITRILNDPEYHEAYKKYDVQRKRKKEREDEKAGFIQIMRSSVRKAFKRKNYTKSSKTFEILGEEWSVVKSHFESLFKEGMSWENYGEWQIDHIIPISSANTKEEIEKLCHYKNLQPLWKEENIFKSDKIL